MEKHQLSALSRKDTIQQLSTETFDILIIGGGITGAGIALDAASRGLKTALVEKVDFAWGTSSRSTKLVHGGLRYLKQLEIALVREVGLERAIVHQNAQHIVIPERMLLPIVEGGTLGKYSSSIGLKVYDWLAGVERSEQRKMLSKADTLKAEPLLKEEGLKGGGLYYEYRTDDARLTIEVLKTAAEYGAKPLNHAKAIALRYDENGQVCGASMQDGIANTSFDINAKVVINAAGPWVDELRHLDKEGVTGKRLHLTKGIHLVVAKEKLPIQQAVYFDVEEDKRMIFAVPRGRITYIGTTDTTYKAAIDEPSTTLEDAEYVLRAVNALFPSVHLTIDDVQSTWAGLRPLIHEDGKSPSELSRKDEIFLSETGLISMAGGKLTGYRKMAERATDQAVLQLKAQTVGSIPKSTTKEIKLVGGRFENQEALQHFAARKVGEAKQIQAPQDHVVDLVYRYGADADVILEKAFELYGKIKDPALRLLAAEIWYGITYEMCHDLNDFFIRRTGRLYFERPSIPGILAFTADQMQQILDWSADEKAHQIEAFNKEFELVMAFARNPVKS
ncbi:MAG: glycerol-3-phosphate dehydrogenase/oxidase [Bacteroidota bacterium]